MSKALRNIAVLVIAGGLAAGGYWYWAGGSADSAAVAYQTVAASKGDIRRTVSTSGPVRAVITVQIGSQLSGQVTAIEADFNVVVKAGQVLARLDPQTFERRVAQARADLDAADADLLVRRANLSKSEAVLKQAEQAVARQRTLAAKKLTPQINLESAQRDASVGEADIAVTQAEIKSAEAAVAQRQAALDQAEIDLDRTLIKSPIDGVVISRTVDVGQTVAASLQAPELFKIAQDLSRIQIEAQVNEADVGAVAADNHVTFTVDAYPERSFSGRVSQVRLAATEVQNIVTYAVIVEALNPDRRLFPGMTANLTIETGVRQDVLRVPNEALRFRPKSTGRAGGDGQRGGGGQARMQKSIDGLKSDVGLDETQIAAIRATMDKAAQQLRPQGGITTQPDPRQFRQAMSARLEQAVASLLTDAQRPAFEKWKRERESVRTSSIFVLDATGGLDSRFVRLGLADDQYTEIAGGELKEGDAVILRTAPKAGS